MKTTLCIIIVVIAIALTNFWHQVYVVGQYYANAGLFLTILGGLSPVAAIYFAYLLITKIKKS